MIIMVFLALELSEYYHQYQSTYICSTYVRTYIVYIPTYRAPHLGMREPACALFQRE